MAEEDIFKSDDDFVKAFNVEKYFAYRIFKLQMKMDEAFQNGDPQEIFTALINYYTAMTYKLIKDEESKKLMDKKFTEVEKILFDYDDLDEMPKSEVIKITSKLIDIKKELNRLSDRYGFLEFGVEEMG